ncbi:MAG TPA: XRE family transcriptional regulator [Cyanobacteria bacterium UBA11367]|nr:XRE family transcriptional regulator [Cyanobacteria bacterium UBA11367]HBE56766.1 XRE family transcriptional regulator [Cyanobacteria bacterium UBA11366]HCA95971.1 XRE family transcriptional regulator [Cyanobacteria bacterium UBA9226]
MIVIKCNLKALMDAQSISQELLKQQTGVSATTIRRYYNNDFSRLDCASIIKICTYFKVDLGQMFFFQNLS